MGNLPLQMPVHHVSLHLLPGPQLDHSMRQRAPCVTRQSHGGHTTVTWWSHDRHMVVTHHHMVVTRQLHGGHGTLTRRVGHTQLDHCRAAQLYKDLRPSSILHTIHKQTCVYSGVVVQCSTVPTHSYSIPRSDTHSLNVTCRGLTSVRAWGGRENPFREVVPRLPSDRFCHDSCRQEAILSAYNSRLRDWEWEQEV